MLGREELEHLPVAAQLSDSEAASLLLTLCAESENAGSRARALLHADAEVGQFAFVFRVGLAPFRLVSGLVGRRLGSRKDVGRRPRKRSRS